jgi:V8-like Glu-specific endopeptidase
MKLIFALALVTTSALASRTAPEINPHISRYPDQKSLDAKDFEGVVKLSNCSGSLVKFRGMSDSHKALVLTNGHCLKGLSEVGQVVVNQPDTREFSVMDAQKKLHPLKATRVVYATQTTTDVTLFEVNVSYLTIKSQYKVRPFIIDSHVTPVGIRIRIPSGYWETQTSCFAEAIAPILREERWTWFNSVRYSMDCVTKGGFSGSPVIEVGTRRIVAIHNTGNNGLLDCSMNNPCESNDKGEVIFTGLRRRYGQQVGQFYGCLTADFKLDLRLPSCELPH